MNVLFVYHDDPGAVKRPRWRGASIAQAIQRYYPQSAACVSMPEYLSSTAAAEAARDQAAVVVFQGFFDDQMMEAIQQGKAQGKTVVIDIDETCGLVYQHAQPHVALSVPANGLEPTALLEDGEARETGAFDQMKLGLRLADAVTISSKWMAPELQSLAEVYVIPPYLDLQKYMNNIHRRHAGLVLGWRCAHGHWERAVSSGMLAGALRVMQDQPGVRLCVWSENDLNLAEAPIPAPLRDLVTLRSGDWDSALALFDVGLIPGRRRWAESGERLEILEYMAMKIPWIASDQPILEDFRPYGWLIQNTPETWERALHDMIDHWDAYQQEAAGEPFLYSISQGIDDHVDWILSFYASIRERALGAGGGLW